MGLLVIAYKDVSRVNAAFNEDNEPISLLRGDGIDAFRVYNPKNCINQLDDLVQGGAYEYRLSESFWQGSYGWYNEFKNRLLDLKAGESAFIEMLNFSDCEGAIGPKTSAKLAKDFEEHDQSAKGLGDEWFYEKYREFQRCFIFASENGAVRYS